MYTPELRLESYTADDHQQELAFRNLRFAKAFQGGEDVWLSFDLDRDIRINYPDLAYGNDVILRRGLTAIWQGEMRQIDQREETITVNCLGRWVHLDDFNHGGMGRLWCDSRYRKWQPIPYNLDTKYWPERFQMDTQNRLYIAPRKHERFALTAYWGAYYYYSPHDPIVRVSFDYEFIDPGTWRLAFYRNTGEPGNWGVETNEWFVGATGSGVKDITLGAPAPTIYFAVYFATLEAEYTGETGQTCRGVIENLRLWGQATESPSVIHVSEAAIDEVEAATPISASHDLVQEQLLVRDTFTGPNATLLTNHQPDVDKERGGWAFIIGQMNIQANEANASAAAGNVSLSVIDAGVSDGIVCSDDETSAAAGNQFVSIVFRYTDVNNFWYWQLDPVTPNVELHRVLGGVDTAQATVAIGIQRQYFYHLMVKLRGDRIDCYLGGIWRCGVNDASHQTATHHGLRVGGAAWANARWDNFEVYQALPLWPLFYEDGESCYAAVKDSASFGDWNFKDLGWGVEPGGDRLYLREADRETVRYVIPRDYVALISVRGNTYREYLSEAWAKYTDEEGISRWTEKYYVHVTNDGLVVNTTATGDDLASVIYGVMKDTTVKFGRVDGDLAIEYLIQHLQEHGHPQTKAVYDVYGPIQDLHRGGAWIDPVELEMGYLVQMPFFRAIEAEGVAGSDLRDSDTTFLLVGMEYDHERGITRLIPEGATEDLKRIIAYARAFQYEQEREHIDKRSKVLGG